MIAAGTHQGSVTLIRGNLTKDRSSRQRVIDTGTSPITGLGFKQVGQSIVLFVSTTEQILSYILTSKDALCMLDAPGCKFNCSVMSDHTQDFRYLVDCLYNCNIVSSYIIDWISDKLRSYCKSIPSLIYLSGYILSSYSIQILPSFIKAL